MQTFLPYKSFAKTAKVLDQKRLGKQRLEASQILDILEGRSDNGWKHHPAVRMWQGYANALRLYYNTILAEWESRGHVNNMPYLEIHSRIVLPPWLRDRRLPLSHRGNLLRKDPDYYGKFGWSDADPSAPYFWPVPMKTPAKQKIMLDYWG
jgi:hypothetical protein